MTNPIPLHPDGLAPVVGTDRTQATERAVLAPLGQWAGDHDVERIADAVLSWDEDRRGFYVNCSTEEFWAIVEQHQLGGGAA